MPNNDYITRRNAMNAACSDCYCCETIDEFEDTTCPVKQKFMSIPAADVEPKQRWIPVTDDSLPDEGEEVLVYDGCYRIAKIERGISVNERERMKRGEIPDPEEWGWNVAEGYFCVKRSEAYKACDEQGNNEKPYCWRADNGRGTLFGQNVKYWMPLPSTEGLK